MYKLIVISLAILLLGCNDDSSKSEASSQSGLEGATSSPEKTTQKLAWVKIGNRQYEFAMMQCNSLHRFGSGKAKDGSDVTI